MITERAPDNAAPELPGHDPEAGVVLIEARSAQLENISSPTRHGSRLARC